MQDFVDFTVEEETSLVGEAPVDPLAQGVSVLPPVTDLQALERAKKQDFGLGRESPGVDALRQEIITGNQDARRSEVGFRQWSQAEKEYASKVRSYIEARPAGLPLTYDETNILMSPYAAPPNTVTENDASIEREYAKQVILTAMNEVDMDRSYINGILERNGVAVTRVADNATKVIAAKEGIQKIVEEYETLWKERSIPGVVGAYALTFVPFYSWYSTQNAVKDARTESLFPGSNRMEQIQAITAAALENPETAIKMAREAIARIHAVSPVDAIDFGKKLIGYTSSDEFGDNFFGAFDIATTLPIGWGIKTVKGLSDPAIGAAKGAIKASADSALNHANLYDSTGATSLAARVNAWRRLEEKAGVSNQGTSLDSLKQSVPSISNPDDLLTGSRYLSREELTRMNIQLDNQAGELLSAIGTSISNPRLVGEVFEAAINRAKELARVQYNQLSDAVLDIKPIFGRETIGSVDQIEIQFGKRAEKVVPPSTTRVTDKTVSDKVYEVANAPTKTLTDREFRNVLIGQGSRSELVRDSYAKAKELVALEKGIATLEGKISTVQKQLDAALAKGELKKAEKLEQSVLVAEKKLAEVRKLAAAGVKEETEKFGDLFTRWVSHLKTPTTVRNADEEFIIPGLGGNVKPSVSTVGKVNTKAVANDNVDQIAIDMGRRDATLFDSPGEAALTARELYGLDNFSVEQHGSKYYIRVVKTVDETDPRVRDALRIQTKNETPKSRLNTILAWVRSPDYLVSERTVKDLTTSTFGAAELQARVAKIVENAFGPMKRWRKEELQRFQKFMENQRDYQDPGTGRRGMYSKSQEDFEQEWFNLHGVKPNEEVSSAYWTYVQLSDFDLVVRNLSLLRDKQRKGLENFTLGWRPTVKGAPYKEGSETRIAKEYEVANDNPLPYDVTTQTPFSQGAGRSERYYDSAQAGGPETIDPSFQANRPTGEGRIFQAANDPFTPPKLEGKLIDRVPWNTDHDAMLLVWDKDGLNFSQVQTKFSKQADRTAAEVRKDIDDKLASGWKLIQLSETGTRALNDSKMLEGRGLSEHIRYVLTPDVKTSALEVNQIPRRPGGHVEYMDGYFIRQASTSVNGKEVLYYGDKTLFHARTEKEAARYTDLINKARLLWKDNAALDTFIQAEMPHLFKSAADFKKQFMATKLDPDVPLAYSAKNVSLGDTGHLSTIARPDQRLMKFKDSEHNLYSDGISFQYLGERDIDRLPTIVNGVPQNSHLVDPLSTMIRANNQLMRSRYLDELKISTSERFIAEFGHLLDAKSLNEIRAHPLSWLLEPKWKRGIDPVEKGAAKAYRRSVVSLLGERSDYQKTVDKMRHDISERYFGTAGEKYVDSVLDVPLIKDPLRFLRAVAFHSKMGFFNLAQFPLQTQTFFHIAAVAGPIRATQAMGGGMLMRTLALTNKSEVINGVARHANKLGWKNPEHFIESWDAMRSTGFARVGREFANIGDFVEETAISGIGGKILDKGLTPFKAAESIVRFTAWNSAYLEWRAANGAARFDDVAKANVLQRANNLSNNMSAASDAAVQKTAVGAVPLQFLSYQARMTEAILTGLSGGKGPLNRVEAVKAMAMHSTLYGVWTGMGVGIGVWPVYETWKKYALDQGYTGDESTLQTVINDGLLAYMSELATGTKFNVAERYGAGGISQIRDILFGSPEEKLKAIGGASFGVSYDILKATYPLAAGYIRGTGDNQFKFKAQDFIDATNSISSINSGMRLWYALNYQKMFTKDLGALADVTSTQAWVSFMTGLTTSDMSDAFKIMENQKQLKEYQKSAEREAIKNYRLSFKAYADGDMENGLDFHKRALLHLEGGGFTRQEQAQVRIRAMSQNQDVFTQAITKYGRNDPKRFDQMIKQLERYNKIRMENN
jgi:hypothetical protein